jgi:hypothetical protein
MRELMPTVAVWRSAGTAADLPVTEGREGDIDVLPSTIWTTRRRTWAESLTAAYTDGIMVLHRGSADLRALFRALRPQRPARLLFHHEIVCGYARGHADPRARIG